MPPKTPNSSRCRPARAAVLSLGARISFSKKNRWYQPGRGPVIPRKDKDPTSWFKGPEQGDSRNHGLDRFVSVAFGCLICFARCCSMYSVAPGSVVSPTCLGHREDCLQRQHNLKTQTCLIIHIKITIVKKHYNIVRAIPQTPSRCQVSDLFGMLPVLFSTRDKR